MSIKISSEGAAEATEPLLLAASAGGGGDGDDKGEEGSWWKKVLDVEETKTQVMLSLPMILTNVFYFLIPLVSVMVVGHLGKLELAGATLANSWATVTGFDFMVGLSGALETLCGQGFGAKLYKMLGIYLQTSCIISIFCSTVVSVFWLYTEPVLILLHQDPEIARAATVYTRYLIPGLFAYGLLQNLMRFLQTQSVVKPLVLLSALPLCIHVGIAYALVYCTSLGYAGAALAASISLWIAVVLLGGYVLYAKEFKETLQGFSFESLGFIPTTLKLALPSAAMVCLEYWAFEILVFMAGLMPNAQLTTSLIAMCVNTETIAYMITCGLSAAASTRVSNELGAGNQNKAKNAVAVNLKLSVVSALMVVLALVFGHDVWARLFSGSDEIIREFAALTPLLAISMAFDSVQGVLSGVARGCGWQHLAVWANLAAFYLIGMPVAAFLGLKLKLYAKGLWIGLICGLSSQACALLLITLRRNWSKGIVVNRGRAVPVLV